LQRPQCVQSIVQCLVFFDTVVAGCEKLACSRHDRVFGVGNPRRDLLTVGFE
jgi:hypothetical protein